MAPANLDRYGFTTRAKPKESPESHRASPRIHHVKSCREALKEIDNQQKAPATTRTLQFVEVVKRRYNEPVPYFPGEETANAANLPIRNGDSATIAPQLPIGSAVEEHSPAASTGSNLAPPDDTFPAEAGASPPALDVAMSDVDPSERASSNGRKRRRGTRVSYADLACFSDSESEVEIAPKSRKKARKADHFLDDDEDEWKEAAASPEPSSDEEDNLDALTASVASESEAEVEDVLDDGEDIIDVEPSAADVKGKPKPRKSTDGARASNNGLDLTLPPISAIDDIFIDMTSKALGLGLDKVCKGLDAYSIRVATMCSGTEAPLLSLQMVQKALVQLGHPRIQLEHVFSAEIEPFKQAYIERNFQPPLLFRDILEFVSRDPNVDAVKGPEATTVYGSKMHVPGDIDILVAGSSCVDNSALNNKKKSIEEDGVGESSQTFYAVVGYAKRVRPPIVILENVIDQKAWTVYEAEFRKIDYATQIVKADTKKYYIPHTRMRKYMICLDKKVYGGQAASAASRWGDIMRELERRASAPVTSFLLSSDDPRYKIVQANSWAKDATQRQIDWEACRGRHEKARKEEGLGTKRPVTGVLPEWADNFIRKRPERDQEVIDIEYLRFAAGGADILYKTRVMDLSQNVDRQGKSPNGISGCLTPKGFPFITDQCRPLSGYENLLLQGIPIDEVLFTSESDADLKDLAGNAMSSTVVGSALVSALIVGHKGIAKRASSSNEVSMDDIPIQTNFTGQELLAEVPAAEERKHFDTAKILEDAAQSARLCTELCEGISRLSKSRILQCKQCGHTTCARCAGNPVHDFAQHKHTRSRLPPDTFETRWRRAFPLQLELGDVPDCEYTFAPANFGAIHANYISTVKKALTNAVFTFEGLHRGRDWTASYVTDGAKLFLTLATKGKSYWNLFVNPEPSEPAGSALRKILKHPVARASLGTNASDFAHGWEWFWPEQKKASVFIRGQGRELRSWRATLGLQEFSDEKVWESLEITATDFEGVDVNGTYKLLPRCGTACNSLYSRIGGESMFFFLDPDPIGDTSTDCFVLAASHHHLGLNEDRPSFLRLDPAWRPWSTSGFGKVSATSSGHWNATSLCLRPIQSEVHHMVSKPVEQWETAVGGLSCGNATIVLTTNYFGKSTSDLANEVARVNTKNPEFWKQYSWMISAVDQLRHLNNWIDMSAALPKHRCITCSPEPPTINWRFENGDSLTIHENHIEAATYERKLKARPEPILIELETGATTTIRLAISIASLGHRAAASLPILATSLAWNLDPDYRDPGEFKFSKFSLRSNITDEPHAQPKRMKHNLREDQLRSLTWMKNQEAGIPFVLSEVEEALLPQLNWKVEVRASAEVTVRGGVLADQPSYGKTVTTLALMHDEVMSKGRSSILEGLKEDCVTATPCLAASLIITPHHLYSQWRDELRKFLPVAEYKEEEVIVIKSAADLKSKSVSDFQRAKVVIVSWKVFEGVDYVAQLAKLAGLPAPVSVKGRQFKVWLQHAVPHLRKNLAWLQDGVKSFAEKVESKSQELRKDEKLQSVLAPSSRKGAQGKGGKKQKPAKSSGNAKIESRNPRIDDWTTLLFPVMHMFRWNRVVVDEFSYLLQQDSTKSYSTYSAIYASVIGLDARYRWVLSGTPPLSNFADVKMIAKFLNLNIGIDDYDPRLTSKKNLSDIRKELSPAERFRSYQDRHSVHWHKSRHELAQRFLDGFVRQNDAEVEHIECYPALNPITLGASHRAVYEELMQYLTSLDMQTRKASELGSNRETEINDSLEESSSPEEALLYRASVFDTSLSSMVERRRAQLGELKNRLLQALKKAEALKVRAGSEEQHYRAWKTENLRDEDSTRALQQLIQRAGQLKTESGKVPKTSQGAILELRKHVLDLRPLARELASRTRALRYVENIRKLQKAAMESQNEVQCEACGDKTSEKLRIISLCGHIACEACLSKRVKDSCAVSGCGGQVDELHIKSLEYFGGNTSAKTEFRYGAKLAGIAELLRKHIPAEDQAILFVPSYLLMSAVASALEHYDVPYSAIEGNEKAVQKTIDDFRSKDPSQKGYVKVLILNMADEQASGLNLTNANHVIFLSPLLASSQYHYDSTMMQAVRRVRRYGQTKKVYVHRFLSLRTIDVDILELREHLLTEPLWERPAAPPTSVLEPNEKNKPVRERARLVRATASGNGNAKAQGCLALVPMSVLRQGAFEGDFASHVKLEFGVDGDEADLDAEDGM